MVAAHKKIQVRSILSEVQARVLYVSADINFTVAAHSRLDDRGGTVDILSLASARPAIEAERDALKREVAELR